MRINFFEEYPTEENMSRLDMVNWSATILIAAPSLQEFERVREKYKENYPHILFGWWPIIPGSYWVSAFSNPADLHTLFKEITSKKQIEELPVLIDLELPRKKYFYIKNFFNVQKNIKIISNFLREASNYNLKIYTAEYPAQSKLLFTFWQLLGISPSFTIPHIKLPMCYTSMGTKSLGNKTWIAIKNFEKKFALSHRSRVGLGLGVTAKGVLGNEPILSPENLAKDLDWAKTCGVEEVFIFRLGGLNGQYIKAIMQSDPNASISQSEMC